MAASDATHEHKRERLSRTRRTIASRMVASWQEVPHIAGDFELDATVVLEIRTRFKARYGRSLPLEALVAHVAVPLLKALPDFNSRIVGDEVERSERCDIGIATDAPHGLLLPVLRDAGALDLPGTAAEVRRLIEAARQRALLPEDMAGATFTVSNIGALGSIGHASSILPPATSAFLSLGSARSRILLDGGKPIERVELPFTVTADHRLIDGGPLVRFADRLKTELERSDLPAALVPRPS